MAASFTLAPTDQYASGIAEATPAQVSHHHHRLRSAQPTTHDSTRRTLTGQRLARNRHADMGNLKSADQDDAAWRTFRLFGASPCSATYRRLIAQWVRSQRVVYEVAVLAST